MLALPELENYKWRRFSYNEAIEGSGAFKKKKTGKFGSTFAQQNNILYEIWTKDHSKVW